MNISSIVVMTRPEHIQEVLKSLEESGLCDIHFYDEKGRIIVTIEGEDVYEETFKLKAIQDIPHVVSAEMSFAYSEEELQKAINEFERVQKEQEVPEILERDDVRAEAIVYKGHIKAYID
ncbi:chaperone NapD [Persephonella sp.]